MPTAIKMPALPLTMEEGTLAKWLVKVGDTVKSGDVMAKIETGKATMGFEAVDEGTIVSIDVAEGAGGPRLRGYGAGGLIHMVSFTRNYDPRTTTCRSSPIPKPARRPRSAAAKPFLP